MTVNSYKICERINSFDDLLKYDRTAKEIWPIPSDTRFSVLVIEHFRRLCEPDVAENDARWPLHITKNKALRDRAIIAVIGKLKNPLDEKPALEAPLPCSVPSFGNSGKTIDGHEENMIFTKVVFRNESSFSQLMSMRPTRPVEEGSAVSREDLSPMTKSDARKTPKSFAAQSSKKEDSSFHGVKAPPSSPSSEKTLGATSPRNTPLLTSGYSIPSVKNYGYSPRPCSTRGDGEKIVKRPPTPAATIASPKMRAPSTNLGIVEHKLLVTAHKTDGIAQTHTVRFQGIGVVSDKKVSDKAAGSSSSE